MAKRSKFKQQKQLLAFRNKVFRLCYRVECRDRKAEAILSEMLHSKDQHEKVSSIVSDWINRRNKQDPKTSSPRSLKCNFSHLDGNPFRPFQGGAPGLGKAC